MQGVNYIKMYPELFGKFKDGNYTLVYFKPLVKHLIPFNDYTFGSTSVYSIILQGKLIISNTELEAYYELNEIFQFIQCYRNSELLRTIYQSRL